jgi:hypothetical protein
MASEVHGRYTIVSRPAWLRDDAVWVPFSVLMWKDNGDFHWREFASKRSFTSEKEAMLFGLTSARAWIAAHPLPLQNTSLSISRGNVELFGRRASDRQKQNYKIETNAHD